MAWTAPRTWVTGEVVTAALMNTHVRDNLLETAAATATTAGDLIYADAANSMGSRLAIGTTGTYLVSTGSAPVWRTVAQTSGDISYTSALNEGGAGSSIDYRAFNAAAWGGGTNVTVTATTGARALVHFGARRVSNNTIGGVVFLSVAVSGATTDVSVDGRATQDESDPATTAMSANRSHLFTALTPGNNTFTLEGKTANTAHIATVVNPYIIVMAL